MAKRLCISIVLLLVSLSILSASAETFHFAVTADPRGQDKVYDALLTQMKEKLGGQGVFQVSPGDIDPPEPLRAKIDAHFGPDAIWYPGIGNHEEETAEDMAWLRAEYSNGNGKRKPLKEYTNQDGPEGCVETNYSWDYGNAHFVMLNQYWNGERGPGSDVAANGDVNDALYNWLKANLAKNTKPVVFVFGHEPAYPKVRHVGDSLDQHKENRDRFWKLLESTPSVAAYICGHTHFYDKHQQPGGRVWQINVGNAGNDGGDGKTFLDVTVASSYVKLNAWRNKGGGYRRTDAWLVPMPATATQRPSSPS